MLPPAYIPNVKVCIMVAAGSCQCHYHDRELVTWQRTSTAASDDQQAQHC